MQPVGRRRMSPLQLCLTFLFLCSTASAAVLGLDFGTQHLKAALVKPGIPLDIVLTKDSKRKEIAALAFKPNRDDKNNIVAELDSFPERAYGSDALALQGRMPGEVFPNLKHLLGLPWGPEAGERVAVYHERYPSLRLEQSKELGTTVLRSSGFADEAVPFSVEELIGMELANVKRNAEHMAGGGVVEDAVITVPAFYTADERQAILRAAGFAGLSVTSLTSDGLAVALDYAKTRTFPLVTSGEKPEHHIVFDMGAGSTTATLVRFQSKKVKDVGRFNKTIQEVTVLGAGWDRTLGGDSLNNVIMQDYIDKLMTKPVMKSRATPREDITSSGRVMARLYKEAERVRQILSANTETTSHFEEILPEIDFRTKLTRADFEKLTGSFADRVAGPIQDALAMAKMTIDEVDTVILHGGAVRTPFVQKQLEGLLGGAGKLRNNVNPDESAVFGAALKAASLSPSFKVKEIWNSDVAAYPVSLLYLDKDKERKQNLFAANSPSGHGSVTKSITFKNKDDFAFGFSQTVNDDERSVLRVQTENLTASVDVLVQKFSCGKDDIKTQFSIRLAALSGLPEVVAGSVSCETDVKSGGVGDAVKDWLGLGKKKDQQPLGDESAEAYGPVEHVDAEASSSGIDSSSSATSTSSGSASASKEAEKPKKRVESISVRVSMIPEGNPQPSSEEMTRMRQRLAAFDLSDKTRLARDEAQNVLESYTYSVRDFLENDDYEVYGTKAQRNEIGKLLQATKEWMEGSGELSTASKAVLQDKLQALQSLVTPIKNRRTEAESRSDLVKILRNSLEETKKLLVGMRNEMKRAEQSSSVDSVMRAQRDASAGMGEGVMTESAQLPTTTAVLSLYQGVDLEPLEEAYDSIMAWLTETEAAQAKLKPHDEPVLRLKDIEKKALEMGGLMQDFMTKKIRAERKAETIKSKSAKDESSKASQQSAAAASASAAAAAAAAADAEADGALPVDTADDVVEAAPKKKPHDEL